jgi:hypothetical protein
MKHLIAHKYCGEPTFDIATQMEDGTWMLNDGHIAYPYWSKPLHNCAMEGFFNEVDNMPDDARDAYSAPSQEPAEKPQALRGLLAKIGLLPKLERRL